MTKTPFAYICMQRATISRYHLCSQQLSISGIRLLYLVYSVTGIPGMAYTPDLILLSCPAWVIQFQSYLLSVSIRGAFQPVGILLWRDNRHTPLCHNLSLCSMITKRPQFVKEFLLFMAVCRYRQEFRHPHTAHDHSQNQMLQTPEIRSVLPDPQVFPSALPESC